MTAFQDIIRARQQQRTAPPTPAPLAATARPVAAPWRPMRQKQAARWAMNAPTGQALAGPQHRAMRLVLETLELARKAGLSEAQMQTVVSATFSRDPGPPARSAGGVGVALLMLCDALGIDAEAAEVDELNRVLGIGEAPANAVRRTTARPSPPEAGATPSRQEQRGESPPHPGGPRRATADAGSA